MGYCFVWANFYTRATFHAFFYVNGDGFVIINLEDLCGAYVYTLLTSVTFIVIHYNLYH